MAGIHQIRTPVGSRGSTPNVKPVGISGEVFDLSDLTKAGSTRKVGDAASGESSGLQGKNTSLARTPLRILSELSSASSQLQSLLSDELLSEVSKTGDSLLQQKLESLLDATLLSPNELFSEIEKQTEGTILFRGELFDILRSLMQDTPSGPLKDAIVDLLKAYNNIISSHDILNAISSNLSTLSNLFTGNDKIVEQLLMLSAEFRNGNAIEDFNALTERTIVTLAGLEKSLLSNNTTRSLSALIIHNLSRYNPDPELISLAKADLLSQIADSALRQKLDGEIDELMRDISSIRMRSDSSDEILLKLSLFLEKSLSSSTYLNLIEDRNGNLAKYYNNLVIRHSNGNDSGLTAIISMIRSLLVGEEGQRLSAQIPLIFESVHSLDALVDKLNQILKNIPDDGLRQNLYDNLVKIIDLMNQNHEPIITRMQAHHLGSLGNLAEFLSANVNDASVNALSNFDPTSLLQGLIASPSFFTPLLHFLLPLIHDDAKAFGELWVDNNCEDSDGGKGSHMLLAFAIEPIGNFELELYQMDSEISISLYCPPEYTDNFSSLKPSIASIAKQAGYSARGLHISPLERNRTLAEVFPKIASRRAGLDVKA